MEMRSLGRSGLQIAPLVFGGNVFGWTADRETSFRLLDAFVAAGFNAIDTADSYSRWVEGHVGGESETVLGEWLESRRTRDKVLILTKVGNDMGQGKVDLSPAHINASIEGSLKRLRTDYVDLYQSHNDDPTVPMDETLAAYDALIKAGKVRAIGASNFSAARLRSALDASGRLGLPRYECLQPLYNLYDRRGFETELAPLCEAEGVGVIGYYGLAAGFLTGKYRSEADMAKGSRAYRIRDYLNTRGFRVLGALDQVAKHRDATPAQVALAWLLTRPALTAPIVSATSVEQWEELAKAVDLKLTADDLSILAEGSA